MSKRNQLNGVAKGLLGSFMSRNNDIDGYWGIGKLHKHSIRHGQVIVELDLIEQSINPEDSHLRDSARAYLQKLLFMVSKVNLSSASIQSAKIFLHFNRSEITRSQVPQTTHGSPYSCEVQIITINGKKFQAVDFGWCDPHDPSRERKSTRVGPSDEKKVLFFSKFFR